MSPEDRSPPDADAKTAFADFLRRRHRGENVDFERFCGDRPKLAPALRVLHSIYLEKHQRSTAEGPVEDGPDTIGLDQRQTPILRPAHPKKVRYCMFCGDEIGAADFCANPDCGRFPNVYRDVPGPHSATEAQPSAAEAAPEKVAPEAKLAPEAPTRNTIRVEPTAVAVLTASPPMSGRHLIYAGLSTVGARRSADILINRPEISATHASLECVRGPDGWELILTDQGSANGTYVNGERIQKKRLLAGDHVRFAKWEFEVGFSADDDDCRVTMQM